MSTACGRCRNFRSAGGNIWYDHYCKGPPEKYKFDYRTGKLVKDELPHCKDINTGDCIYYEPIKTQEDLWGTIVRKLRR